MIFLHKKLNVIISTYYNILVDCPNMMRITLQKSVTLPLLVLVFTIIISATALLINPQRERTNFAIKSQAGYVSCDLAGFSACVAGSDEASCGITYGYNIQSEVGACMNESSISTMVDAYVGCVTALEPTYGTCLDSHKPLSYENTDYSTVMSNLNTTCESELQVTAPEAAGSCDCDFIPDPSWVSTNCIGTYDQNSCETAYTSITGIQQPEEFGSSCVASAVNPTLSCTNGQSECLATCSTSYDASICASYCGLGSAQRCTDFCVYDGNFDLAGCTNICSSVGYVPDAPANDLLANATSISINDTLVVDNTYATTEADPVANGMNNSVWYTFTPSVDGEYTIDLCSSAIANTVLYLYQQVPEGSPTDYLNLSRLEVSTINDTICTTQSAIKRNLTAGEVYYFEVGTADGQPTGSISVHLTQTPPPISIADDGSEFCENHGDVFATAPVEMWENSAHPTWHECRTWCFANMSAAHPLCQWNGGNDTCWVLDAPGGDINACNWITGGLPSEGGTPNGAYYGQTVSTANLAQFGNGRTALYSISQEASPLQIMTDGILTNSNQSFDGNAQAESYWGISFSEHYNFNRVVYTTGNSYPDGGWYSNGPKIQVRQNGVWTDVTNTTVSPSYPNNISALPNKSYTFSFNNITGDAVRVIGTPPVIEGSAYQFTSIGEIEIYNDGNVEPQQHSISASIRESSDRAYNENGFFRGNFDNTILWNVLDLEVGDVNTISLYYSVDGGEWQSIATGEVNDGAYNWFPTPALDGAVQIKVESTDQNSHVFNTTVNVTFDSTLPIIAWNQEVTLDSNPISTINVLANDTNLDTLTMGFSASGDCWTALYVDLQQFTPITSNTNIELTKADHANQYVCINVTDKSANSQIYTSTNKLIPNYAPHQITATITENSPRSGNENGFFRGGVDTTINWEVTDPDLNDVNTISIYYSVNSGDWQTIATGLANDGVTGYMWHPSLIDGSVEIRVQSEDQNTNSFETVINVTFDSTAPVINWTTNVTQSISPTATINISAVDTNLDTLTLGYGDTADCEALFNTSPEIFTAINNNEDIVITKADHLNKFVCIHATDDSSNGSFSASAFALSTDDVNPPVITFTSTPGKGRFINRPIVIRGYVEDEVGVEIIQFSVTKNSIISSDLITVSCQDANYANHACGNTREYFTIESTSAMENLAGKTLDTEPQEGVSYQFNIYSRDPENNIGSDSTLQRTFVFSPGNDLIANWDFEGLTDKWTNSPIDTTGYFTPLAQLLTQGFNGVEYWRDGDGQLGVNGSAFVQFGGWDYDANSCSTAKFSVDDLNRNFDFSGSNQQFTASAWVKSIGDTALPQIVLSKASTTAGQDNWAIGIDQNGGIYCSFEMTNGTQTITSTADNDTITINPNAWTEIKCIYNNGTIAAIIGDKTVAEKSFPGETLLASSGKVYVGNSNSCHGFVGQLDDVSVMNVAEAYDAQFIDDGSGPSITFTSLPGDIRFTNKPYVIRGYVEDGTAVNSIRYWLSKNDSISSSNLLVNCQDENYNDRACGHAREYFTIYTTEAMQEIAVQTETTEPSEASTYRFNIVYNDTTGHEAGNSGIVATAHLTPTANTVGFWDFESTFSQYFGNFSVNAGTNPINLFYDSTDGADGGRYLQLPNENYAADSCNMSSITVDDYNRNADFAGANQQFTLEAWVRNTTAKGSPQIVLSKAGAQADQDTFVLGIDATNGLLCGFNMTGGFRTLSSEFDNPAVTINPSQWTNIKCIFNNGTIAGMINNIPVAVKYYSGETMVASDQKMYIANSKSCNGFVGDIDEVKITNVAYPIPQVHTLSIISPTTNANVRGGSVQNIRWSVLDTDQGDTQTIDLAYSSNSGNTWTTIDTGVSNTGSYMWTVPMLNMVDVQLRLTAHDTNSNDFSDTILFNVDSVSPVITWNQDITVDGLPTYLVNVSAEDINLDTLEYGFSVDSTCNSSDTYGNTIQSSIDFEIDGIANDTKYLCIKATDTFDHVSYSVSLNPIYSIDIAPVIVINPLPNADRVETITPTFTGRITDPDGIAGAEYLLFPTEFIRDEYNIGRLDDQNWQPLLPDGGTWGTDNTFTVTATSGEGFTTQPDPEHYLSWRSDFSQGNQFMYIRAWDNHYNDSTPENLTNTLLHKSSYNNTWWIYAYGIGTDHTMAFYKIFIESKDTTAPDILSSYIVPDPTTDPNPSIHGYIKDDTVDKTSNITSIKYKLDDGEWIDLNPYNKSAFNSPNEEFNIQLSGLSTGEHTLTVRAIDASGNDTNDQGKNFVDVFTVQTQTPSAAEIITKTENFSTRNMNDQFNTTAVWGNGYARARQTIQFAHSLEYNSFSSAEMGYLYGARVVGVYASTDPNYLWLGLNDRSFAYYNISSRTLTKYTTLRDGVNGNTGIDAFPGIREVSVSGRRYLVVSYNAGGAVVIYDLNETLFDTSDDNFITFDDKFGNNGGRFGVTNASALGNSFVIEGIRDFGEVVRINTQGTVMDTSDDTVTIWGTSTGMQHNPAGQMDTVGLLFDNPKGYFLGTNYYYGGLNICSTSSSVCGYNSSVSTGLFHIEKDLVQDNLYWLGGNSGLYLYDTKGTIDAADDIYTAVRLRNVDLAGEWVSEVKVFPGVSPVGEEVFMFTNLGRIRVLETNNTPTDLLDDTDYLFTLPSELYRNPNGVSSYFASKNSAWIFMPGTGLFNIAMARGFQDNNVVELLPSPPQGKLEVNHIKLNSVNGSNLTAQLQQNNKTGENKSFIANLLTSTATPAFAADPTALVEYFVSNNNGLTWYPITIGEQVDFPTSDYQLKFKAILHPTSGITPVLTNIDLSYALYPNDSAIDPTLALEYPTAVSVGETFDGGVQLLDELGYTPNWNGTIQLNLVSATQPSQSSTCITHPQAVTVTQGEVTFNSRAVCPGRYQFVGQTVDGGLKAVGHQILVSDPSSNYFCGNGTLESGEQCDRSVGALTCADFGFNSGELKCSNICRLDTSLCNSTTTTVCGNGTVETGEQCDGNDIAITCSEVGTYSGGTLSCTSECQLDTTKCNPVTTCGNNVIDTGEQCDGTAINKTCEELNAGTGIPSCTNACTLDTTVCIPKTVTKDQDINIIDTIANSPISKSITGAIAVISAVLSLSILNLTLFDIQVIVVSWWFNILNWLGIKKKGQQFGLVYNTITKEPVSQAIVRIYNSENKLLKTEVTDTFGIFTTQVEAGKYRIEVLKQGFAFPSKLIKGTEDSIYTNIYNGGLLDYSDKANIIVSVPIDPEKSTFSQILKTLIKANAILTSRIIHLSIFVISLVISIRAFNNDSSLVNGIILLFYIPSFILLLISMIDTRVKLGRVTDATDNAISGLPLGLKETDFDRLVAKRVTDEEGFYRFIMPSGKYNFELLDQTYIIENDLEQFKAIDAKENPSVIAKNFKVRKAKSDAKV